MPLLYEFDCCLGSAKTMLFHANKILGHGWYGRMKIRSIFKVVVGVILLFGIMILEGMFIRMRMKFHSSFPLDILLIPSHQELYLIYFI